jgi:hypothetical protein
MDRFNAKLRKIGLREETIRYVSTKERWDAMVRKEPWSRLRPD